MKLAKIWPLALALTVAFTLPACDDDDAATDGGAGGAAGADVDAGPDAEPADVGIWEPEGYVAFREDEPLETLDDTVAPTDAFPLLGGAAWRYRKQESDFQNPPPVTVGSESRVVAGPGGDGNCADYLAVGDDCVPEDDCCGPGLRCVALNTLGTNNQCLQDFARETLIYLDLDVNGAPSRVRQRYVERFAVKPGRSELLGPAVYFLGVEIHEQVAETQEFLRFIERVYTPPYLFMADSVHFHEQDNDRESTEQQVTEYRMNRGEVVPTVTTALVPAFKIEAGEKTILPMEGAYRDDVYQVDVYDDFTSQKSRTYWVQPGVGVVQWRFRDSNNITFTLLETNVQAAE